MLLAADQHRLDFLRPWSAAEPTSRLVTIELLAGRSLVM
jgi:hypothetical protein